MSRIFSPIKHQLEWSSEIRKKLKDALRDEVWSQWKRVSVKGGVTKNDPLTVGLLIERGVLYWAGGIMKVKRPTGARVSKWIRDNLDVRNDVVYGGLSQEEVRSAQKLKELAYAGMIDFIHNIEGEKVARVVDEINIDKEVRKYLDRVRMEIRSSVGNVQGLDEEMKWQTLTKRLVDNIKHEVGSVGGFEIERFKVRGVELLESSNVQDMENWFGTRYCGAVVERRVDIRVESEAKKIQVDSMSQILPQAGMEYYVWTTRRDSKVRPDHARLEGRICNWNDPPVVDLRSGRRRHPGEDYNCRCTAAPMVK